MIVTTKASSCSGKALAEEDPLSRRKVANEQTGEPRSLRSSRGRFSSGSGTATGPRDTASDPDPVRLPLCPRRPRSEGSLALFAAPATQRAPPPNIGRQERGRRGSRRPSHPAPGAPRPSTQRTPRRGRPAGQPASPAASRRRCGAAFRTNSLQPLGCFPSKASQGSGRNGPRRRNPDAAHARHFRPSGRRGR